MLGLQFWKAKRLDQASQLFHGMLVSLHGWSNGLQETVSRNAYVLPLAASFGIVVLCFLLAYRIRMYVRVARWPLRSETLRLAQERWAHLREALDVGLALFAYDTWQGFKTLNSSRQRGRRRD